MELRGSISRGSLAHEMAGARHGNCPQRLGRGLRAGSDGLRRDSDVRGVALGVFCRSFACAVDFLDSAQGSGTCDLGTFTGKRCFIGRKESALARRSAATGCAADHEHLRHVCVVGFVQLGSGLPCPAFLAGRPRFSDGGHDNPYDPS